jgi:hypothetical protein
MGIGTGGALAIGLGTSAAAGLGSAALGANAAGNAAKAQSNAANYAANLQAEEAQQALNLQAGAYNQTQQTAAPFIQGGESAYANLENLLGITPSTFANTPLFQPTPLNPGTINYPGTNSPVAQAVGYSNSTGIQPAPGSNIAPVGARNPALQVHAAPGTASTTGAPTLGSTVNPALGATGSLSQGWNQTFQSPTLEQAEKAPGYQFQLEQGLNAIQNSAAARGDLLSGNALTGLNNYAQGAAQSDYNNVYNQALQNYQTNYNTFQNNQTNEYNRLASLAGLGQQTASQLNSAGLGTANNAANTLLTAGSQIGQDTQNATAATASGYVGGANAWGGALGNVGANVGQLATLEALLGNNGGGGSVAGNGFLGVNTV